MTTKEMTEKEMMEEISYENKLLHDLMQDAFAMRGHLCNSGNNGKQIIREEVVKAFNSWTKNKNMPALQQLAHWTGNEADWHPKDQSAEPEHYE